MRKFDADRLAEEGAMEATIGGEVFIAREPTLALMKEVATKVPAIDPDAQDGEDPGKRLERAVDSVFPQLEVLLRHKETGDPPTREFIEENLTMKRAGELIRSMMGDDEAAANPR